jgi:[ribosomal protein S5]-alanine N-acetyltransferase
VTDQPILETPRLRLRPLALADASVVQALAGAREVADTTIHIPHPYPDGLAEAWIGTHAAAWDAGQRATYAIVDAAHGETADGALRGVVALTIEAAHARAELGYWVGAPYWGRGIATEAARALVGFGFARLALHRVQARHLTRNPASGRVMQKLGMRLEGVHREAFLKWGRYEDTAMYAVLDREWGAGG